MILTTHAIVGAALASFLLSHPIAPSSQITVPVHRRRVESWRGCRAVFPPMLSTGAGLRRLR